MNFRLLTHDSPKIKKSKLFGWDTGVLYLAPYTLSGLDFNLCPNSTKECREICLYDSGYGKIIPSGWDTNNVKRARIAKTRELLLDSDFFLSELNKDIIAGKKKYNKFCVRLNGTSDINWMKKYLIDNEKSNLMSLHPDVQFYDYTKCKEYILKNDYKNYHFTFSFSGHNKRDCILLLKKGINVAVIFRGKLPKFLWGFPVIDGDIHDLRFLDPKGVIVGLKAKGNARDIYNRMIL